MHRIYDERSDTADTKPTEEHADAFGSVGMFGDFECGESTGLVWSLGGISGDKQRSMLWGLQVIIASQVLGLEPGLDNIEWKNGCPSHDAG